MLDFNLKQRTETLGFRKGVKVEVKCGFDNRRRGVVQDVNENGTIDVSTIDCDHRSVEV